MREIQSLIDVKKAPNKYVDTAGDIITGVIDFKNGGFPTITNPTNGTANVGLNFFENVPRIRYGGTGDGAQSGFVIAGSGDAVKFKIDNNGELYAGGTKRVYHTSFKPSASDVGALPLGGGTLTGNLQVHDANPNFILKNTSNADVSLTLDRGINANWRLRNSSGTLHFECDYTGSKGSYYAGAKLEYNSGNFMAKGELYAQNGQRVYHTNNKPSWNDILNKPSTFAPSGHNHTYITGGTANKIQADQPNDYAGLEKKNNVNIDSWYGFSITNKCTNQTVGVDEVAFSVNARNGHVWTKGEIYANWDKRVYHTANKPDSIKVIDTRDTDPTPAEAANSMMTTFFNNRYGGDWKSGITVKGWSGDYCTWQLCSSASTSAGEELSFRAGVRNGWNAWRRIYHEGYKPTPSDIGALGKTEKAESAKNSDRVNGRAFNWSFGTGSPTHIWGSSGSSSEMNVWEPRSITVGRATSADSVAWANITGKPGTYSPSTHNHSWNDIQSKPSSFTPSSHGHDVITTKSVTDWNTAQTNGFWQGESKPNAPETSGWFWGFRMQHGSGYGAQIAVGNGTSKIYFRSQSADGSGPWHRIYHAGNKPTASEIGAMAQGGTYSTIYLNDWIRTKGSTGVYFQDHGGGWHMTDSSWIRAYQNKGIYTGGTINAGNVQVNGNNVYHTGRTPSCAEIGAMRMQKMSPSDYYVMGDIYGSFSDFIKTPDSGLLPFQPGSGYLGDAGNRFSHVYANVGDFNDIYMHGKDARILMNGEFGNSGDICVGWNNKAMGRFSVIKGNWYGINSNRWLRLAVADENDVEDQLLSLNAEGGNWIVHSASMCGQSDNSRELGSPNYRYKKVYSAGGVATSSDEKMKQNIKYIDKKPKATRSKRNAINLMTINSEEDLDNFEINTNDCYNFIKDTPYATYFYKKKVRSDASTKECEEADKNGTLLTPSSDDFMVGFIAQDIAKSKVGRMFLDYYEETGYNYNLNNYVGIIAKALQEAMVKIEALESQLEKIR